MLIANIISTEFACIVVLYPATSIITPARVAPQSNPVYINYNTYNAIILYRV